MHSRKNMLRKHYETVKLACYKYGRQKAQS